MKTVFFSFIILIGQMVLANNTGTVVEFDASVSAAGLACVTTAGDHAPIADRTYTVVDNGLGMGLSIIPIPAGSIELQHKQALKQGCDIAILDKLVKDSHSQFGFLNILVSVEKKNGPLFIDSNGQCAAGFFETLTLNFPENVTLVSEEYEVRAATGCN